MDNNNIKNTLKNWPAIVSKYQKPNNKKAVNQLITRFPALSWNISFNVF